MSSVETSTPALVIYLPWETMEIYLRQSALEQDEACPKVSVFPSTPIPNEPCGNQVRHRHLHPTDPILSRRLLKMKRVDACLFAEAGWTHRTCSRSIQCAAAPERGAAVTNTLTLLPATCARRAVAHLRLSLVTSGWGQTDAVTDPLYKAPPEGYKGKTLPQRLK